MLSASTSLTPQEIAALRETFQIIDQNHDNVISQEDLEQMLATLGLPVSDAQTLLAPATLDPKGTPSKGTPKLNMARFVNLMAARVSAIERHDILRDAFASFDIDDSGKVSQSTLREALLRAGDPATAKEVELLFSGFVDSRGQFDYNAFLESVSLMST